MGCFNTYLYELFWGTWEIRYAKALYYGATALILIYTYVDELIGGRSDIHFQINLITKAAVIVNFILFFLIQFDLLREPIIYLFTLNGSVFAISIMVLLSALKHGAFKN